MRWEEGGWEYCGGGGVEGGWEYCVGGGVEGGYSFGIADEAEATG